MLIGLPSLNKEFTYLLTDLHKNAISLRFQTNKNKTLGTAKQTEGELNKAAVSSSAINTNKRLTFLKFDYRKYSYFLLITNLHAIYV